jgi:hypothetical protein
MMERSRSAERGPRYQTYTIRIRHEPDCPTRGLGDIASYRISGPARRTCSSEIVTAARDSAPYGCLNKAGTACMPCSERLGLGVLVCHEQTQHGSDCTTVHYLSTLKGGKAPQSHPEDGISACSWGLEQ